MGFANFNGTNPSRFKDEFFLLYKRCWLSKNYNVKLLQDNEILSGKNIK